MPVTSRVSSQAQIVGGRNPCKKSDLNEEGAVQGRGALAQHLFPLVSR